MRKVWNELTHPMTRTAHWLRIFGIMSATMLLSEQWNWFYAVFFSYFVCQEIYYLIYRSFKKTGEEDDENFK